MPSINVDGSAARLLANGTLAAAGYCLHYCWLAISQGLVHYITGGADTAYDTWLAVPAEYRHSSRNVPKDMPAFLGPRAGSTAGDVIISRGDGTFVATDWPTAKKVGICTLAQRETQTGRHFVGWASSMGGYELTTTTMAGTTGSAIPSDSQPERKKNLMSVAILRTSNGHSYTLGDYGTLKHHATTQSRAAEEAVSGPAIALDDGQFVELLINRGLYEFVPAGSLTVMNNHASGAEFIASFLKTKTAPAGTVDLSPVLAAIDAIPKPLTKGTVTLS